MSDKKSAILEKLAKLNKQKKSDYSESEKKESIYAPFDRSAKNEYLFLPFKSTITEDDEIGDMFASWNYHKGLNKDNPKKEIHALSNFLKPEEKNNCPINKAILELKKDFIANKPIWGPIVEQTKFIAPIINLNDIESGVKFFTYKVSVKRQFETEIENMEDDENFFWDLNSPKKVIITFDGDAPAATMYSVSFKEIKDKKLLKLIQDKKEEWLEKCVDLNEIFKNYWDLQKRQELIEGYLESVEDKAKTKKKEIENDLNDLIDDDDE